MREYSLGAWESLNYVIHYLEENDKEESLQHFKQLKAQLEENAAPDFYKKMSII